MPRIPIFSFGRTDEEVALPRLNGYTPSLPLEGLQLGIDNLRHDVHLSPRFVVQTRSQISRLIVRHGDVEGLLAAATTADLHSAVAAGVRGPAIADLTISKATSGTIGGSIDLTPQQLASLHKGGLYVQIYSEKAPEGVLWGWFLK